VEQNNAAAADAEGAPTRRRQLGWIREIKFVIAFTKRRMNLEAANMTLCIEASRVVAKGIEASLK
jgi:hypothetical protein